MTRTTIDYGIDLGTTNSRIAVFDGTGVKVIRNKANNDSTPSAVWLAKSGRLFVGAPAYKQLEVDPDNAFAEFKLQMGTETDYKFLHGQTMRPEELSAEILKSLKADAQRVNGEDLQAAVITVPASFELLQIKATSEAAQLAGLSHTPLLQEPVAAAMAYGFQSKSDKAFWLVYDFGGGTFDAAVVSVRDGLIQVVDHGGDNHLGGKLIDWEIVNQLLVPALLKERKLTDFRPGNPKWIHAFAKLKHYAEEAKIQVSIDDTAPIFIDPLCKDDKGDEVNLDYDLRREDVERLMEPFVFRSINTCRRVLLDSRLGTANIEKVLLVGGPTVAPYLRQRLADPNEGLGIALDYTIDPMTVVARGAAVYASTQRVASRVEEAGDFAIELDYKPVGTDHEPVIGGQVAVPAGGDISGYTIEFVNSHAQPGWRSERIGLDSDGAFTTSLWAEPGRENVFNIELRDASGSLRKSSPGRITYRVGMAAADPLLTHTVGVALANNEMIPLVEKGTPLPARKRLLIHANVEVRHGGTGDLILLPIVEGENLRQADRNTLIGTLRVNASNALCDIPAGSEIEILIEIDQSRLIRTKAYIPCIDEEFETEFDNAKENQTFDQLRIQADGEKSRLESVRRRAVSVGDPIALGVLRRVEDERMVHDLDAVLGGAQVDRDAAHRCSWLFLRLRKAVDEVEGALHWPELVLLAENEIRDTSEVVRRLGKSDDRDLAAVLEKEAREAIGSHEADVLRQKTEEITSLHLQVMRDQPPWWTELLEQLEGRRNVLRDNNQAEYWFNTARRAMDLNDFDGLRSAVRRLMHLLPAAQHEKLSRGFNSSVSGPTHVADNQVAEVERRTPEVPASRIDSVHFSASAPPIVKTGERFVLSVSAHMEEQRAEVERRVELANPQPDVPRVIRSQGPFEIERGTKLFVSLQFGDFHVESPEEVLLWNGNLGNTSFIVAVPEDISLGPKIGLATVRLEGGLQIARVPIEIHVAAAADATAPASLPFHRIGRAFISYASQDREKVAGRIQGMQKFAPKIEVVFDQISIRSGEYWEKKLWEEIPRCDVLFLFWSANAKASPWVEKEWRCGLKTHGLDFIDPVPLVHPDEVPPPDELKDRNFYDWILAFERGRPKAV